MTESRRRADASSIGQILGLMAFGAVCLWQPTWIVSGFAWGTTQVSRLMALALGSDWSIRMMSAYIELCEQVVRVVIAGLMRQ